MKILRIFLCAVFLLTTSAPAVADSFSSKFGTMHLSPKLNRSMMLPETVTYKARVEADGGTVLDLLAVNAYYLAAKTNGYSTNLLAAYAAWAGVKKDTLAVTAISGFTANISNVASYYFITNPSTALNTYTGKYLVLKDSAGKYKVMQLGAAGTEETLDAEKLTGPFTTGATHPYETFTSVAIDVAAINTVSTGRCMSNLMVNTLGELYKYTGTLTLASGEAPSVSMGIDGGGYFSQGITAQTLNGGVNNKYFTCSNSTFDYIGYISTTATNYSIPDGSFKKVLTPDTTGIWFTPVSEEVGWNPNDTYTAYISNYGGIAEGAVSKLYNLGTLGAAADATQTTGAAQPIWTANVQGTIPGILFNGTTHFLNVPAIDLTGASKITLTHAIKGITPGAGSTVLWEMSADAGAQTDSFLSYINTTGTTTIYAKGNTGVASNTSQSSAATNAFISVMQVDKSLSTNEATQILNGTAGTVIDNNNNTGAFGNRASYIGARAGTSLFLNGKIIELMLLNTNTDKATVSTDINSRLGVY